MYFLIQLKNQNLIYWNILGENSLIWFDTKPIALLLADLIEKNLNLTCLKSILLGEIADFTRF